MEELHLPNNIKVHYAGAENKQQEIIVRTLGVSYSLYTAYPFVSSILKGRKAKDIDMSIPRALARNYKHVIQDSGLFTLMFGAMKGKKDAALMNKWYDSLVDFTLTCNNHATVVEVDCQKVLGVEAAWDFRKRMKHDLPNNRIINVFHLEDGQKGLDRLIDFSEYIAISVPELRFAHKLNQVDVIAKYIKKRKPNIDIHLLGCTDLKILHRLSFCTSADSTTYKGPIRFGYIQNHHIDNIKEDYINRIIKEEDYKQLKKMMSNVRIINALLVNIEYLKKKYQDAAGNQDYYIMRK